MLKFFIALLLIAKGMTDSDICDKPRPCRNDDMPDKFPETEEELENFCRPGIEYMKCSFEFEMKCYEPTEEQIQIGYRMIATLEEICSKDTLLHAAVVDNLKCLSNLVDDETKMCPISGESSDRIRQFTEALSEEGLVTLTENESDDFTLRQCINLMNFFACQSLTLERECGTVAMDVYVDIVQKIGPGVAVGCENSYDLLPAVIRLYKLEEEKENSIIEAFRKKK